MHRVASSGILNDEPPKTPPPYVPPKIESVKSVGVLSYSSKAGSTKSRATSRRSRSPISQAIDPSSLKPQAPVDRMEKIAMTCNARKFLSLTVKPEDFSHMDDNIGKSSGKVSISNASTAGPKDDALQLSETHTVYQSRVMLTERRMPLIGKMIKAMIHCLPSRFFATQNSPRNKAKVVRVKVKKKKPFCAWNKTYKKLNVGEEAFGKRDVGTVAASGPYISDYKSQRLEYLRAKLNGHPQNSFCSALARLIL